MAESKRSSETSYACERGLKHELINSEPLSCLAGTLSPSGEGKEGCVGEMKENNFLDKVYSLFISHFSLKLKHSVAPIIKLVSILLEALVLLELF